MDGQLVGCITVLAAAVGIGFQVIMLIAVWRLMVAHESHARNMEQIARAIGGGRGTDEAPRSIPPISPLPE